MKRENIDIAISELKSYEANARTHSDKQVAQLMRSIEEFGFTNPILIDETNTIIAGHGRVTAASRLQIATVPAVRLIGLTADQRRALVIADNQLALNAGWDGKILAAEIEKLIASNFNTDLLGFKPAEINRMMQKAFGGENNTAPAPPPRTRLGDVWLCGDHRIMCGDATVATDVERLLAGKKPHLMVTDPPYGVDYDADWRNHTNVPTRTAKAVGKVENDSRADWREAWALFEGDVVYVWHAGTRAHLVAISLIECGFDIRQQIIWNKNQLVIGRGDYHPKHEPCWYAVRKGKTGHYNGDRQQSTVWDIDKPRESETGHSTQKPVECMRRPIVNNSNPGDFVYEPFSGSGTTMIACEDTKRLCLAMELNPAYVDLAVARWQAYSGKKATLESTGEPFDQETNK